MDNAHCMKLHALRVAMHQTCAPFCQLLMGSSASNNECKCNNILLQPCRGLPVQQKQGVVHTDSTQCVSAHLKSRLMQQQKQGA